MYVVAILVISSCNDITIAHKIDHLTQNSFRSLLQSQHPTKCCQYQSQDVEYEHEDFNPNHDTEDDTHEQWNACQQHSILSNISIIPQELFNRRRNKVSGDKPKTPFLAYQDANYLLIMDVDNVIVDSSIARELAWLTSPNIINQSFGNGDTYGSVRFEQILNIANLEIQLNMKPNELSRNIPFYVIHYTIKNPDTNEIIEYQYYMFSDTNQIQTFNSQLYNDEPVFTLIRKKFFDLISNKLVGNIGKTTDIVLYTEGTNEYAQYIYNGLKIGYAYYINQKIVNSGGKKLALLYNFNIDCVISHSFATESHASPNTITPNIRSDTATTTTAIDDDYDHDTNNNHNVNAYEDDDDDDQSMYTPDTAIVGKTLQVFNNNTQLIERFGLIGKNYNGIFILDDQSHRVWCDYTTAMLMETYKIPILLIQPIKFDILSKYANLNEKIITDIKQLNFEEETLLMQKLFGIFANFQSDLFFKDFVEFLENEIRLNMQITKKVLYTPWNFKKNTDKYVFSVAEGSHSNNPIFWWRMTINHMFDPVIFKHIDPNTINEQSIHPNKKVQFDFTATT